MKSRLEALIDQFNGILVGKEDVVRLAVACLVARGHLLIEDIPGVGKTTLAHALAGSVGLDFRRVQFTSDLLPADVIGNTIFDRDAQTFNFHPGPVFSQALLIDEINRATPKTQSALLEAMEEQQVSIDGVVHPLPSPFFVVATQNPREQIGTFSLPESQLDRFMMRLSIGFPGRGDERRMLTGENRKGMLRQLQPVIDSKTLMELQASVEGVHVSDRLLDYLQDLLDKSRNQHRVGLSPRAGLALLRASRAWALMKGRDSVWPEDVQAVAVPVMAHRLWAHAGADGSHGEALAQELIRTVPVAL